MSTKELTLDEVRKALQEEQDEYDHFHAVSQENARSMRAQRISHAMELLGYYQEYIDFIAGKMPEEKMTPFQIRMMNELLRNCQELLKGREGTEFLQTAKEDITYGEMSILLTPYGILMWELSIGRI